MPEHITPRVLRRFDLTLEEIEILVNAIALANSKNELDTFYPHDTIAALQRKLNEKMG